MGGKSKQRTKNNVRPSSSSRSADILNNSVKLDSGLMSNGVPALFPTLAAVNLDKGLNPEIQMCIKKLNKKDPITRAKALQELCDLVNAGNVEDVVAALPSWAHFYKALTADTDRKVREVTQICHHAIMRVCGRRAAPQLKVLLPSWLQAQYDEHAPAQTNAQQSLKNTFPDSKLPEVISFCKAEVMAHLVENLIGNTEAIISKKIENPEERDLQMCRIITSSLRGVEYFVPSLPEQHHAWLWEQLAPLLEAGAHWKFGSHNAHQVRAAWYGAMGRIMERFKGQFGEKYGLKSLRLMLNDARDSNPQVAAQIWTCLLQFMHNVENWHQYLEKKDLLVKRILDLLETGGWGDAKHLSTMLLPLLAHMPQDILTKEFYETFFKAVYKGLDNKNVLMSKTEQRAWVTSLAECLRYLSIQENDFVIEVATGVHRVWLEKVLITPHDEQTTNNLIKCSATNMTSIAKYWLKLSKEGNADKYDQLLRNYWENIGSTIWSQIDKCGTDLSEIDKLIEGHIILLQTLKTAFVQETKKRQCIKFHGDEKTVEEKSPVAIQQVDPSILERYTHNLDQLVHKVCAHYFEMAEKKQVSNAILTPLITLLVEYDSKNLFVALANQFNMDSPYKFYHKVLRTWLAGDTMRCKAVVDIVFLMTKYLSENDQNALFDSFKQLTPVVVEWCLAVCMSHPYVEQSASRRWAQSGAASDAVARLAHRAATHNDVRATALLFMCLADGPDGEQLISDDGVSKVIRTVSAAVEDCSSATLEASGALAARLATTLAGTEHVIRDTQHFAALVRNLYRINLVVPRGHQALSPDTWCEILSSWQDGAASLPDATRKDFHVEACKLMHIELFNEMNTTVNISKIDHIVSLSPYLFHGSVGENSDQPADFEEILAFSKLLLELNDKESLAVETCALRHLCVTGQMNCLYTYENISVQHIIKDSDQQNPRELTNTEMIRYLNSHLFHACYFKTLLMHKLEPGADQDSEERTSWCNTLLSNNYIQTEFCKMTYFCVVLDALHEGYSFWPQYEHLVRAKQRMDELIKDIIEETSQPVRDMIIKALCELAAEKGYFWAFAHRLYKYHALRACRDVKEFGENELRNAISGNGYFHMIQAAAKWSADETHILHANYFVMLRSWNIAFSDHSLDKVNADEYDFDVIINAYYSENQSMLYDKDISDAPWAQVVSNATVLEFLALMVKHQGWDLAPHYWDFITITLCSLISSVRKSLKNWGCTKVAMVTRAVMRLFYEVRTFVKSIRKECERREPQAHVVHLMTEWKDIFAPETQDNIFHCIMDVLNSSECLTYGKSQVLSVWRESAPLLEWSALAPRAAAALPLCALARRAAAALRAHPPAAPPALKYLAYNLILALATDLVFDDAKKLELWSEESLGDEEKERPKFSLDYFHDTFTELQELVETAVSHIVPGEATCELVPFSDSHNMALGWLLLADAMAKICRLARGDLTQFYIQVYREGKYTAPQLTVCLRLLPAEVFAFAQDSTGQTPAPITYKPWFLEVRDYNMRSICGATDVSALACRGVLTAVCGAGCSAARGWWGAARPPVARALERLVVAYVAPHAVRDQLSNLQDKASDLPDTEIRIAWSSKEVVCDYKVEESTIQLHVLMSPAHPLVPPRLTAPVVTGPGSNTQWLTLYLAYQNGTILNALKMWTEAVNARVEKSPQCYICYCRLHPGTGRLPRVLCHQCKNKFHETCLRKWFSTSNKSNCPLCRATF